jgi:2-C-methyl-D-erythritol 2,4-cyclodiphosphate synthase
MDALLGAAGLEDIGFHFPDTDPSYKGISSILLLEKVSGMVTDKGYRVGNVDVMVLAEEPRLRPFSDSIQANLARMLLVDPEDISIKATTMEGKGCVGRKEGIAVQAVTLLYLDS